MNFSNLKEELFGKHFIYYLFAAVVLLVFISFFYIELFISKKSISLPLSTPIPANFVPPAGQKFDVTSPSDEQKIKEGNAASQLIKSLPYQGKDFYLDYFYSKFQMKLTLYKGRETAGQKEFEDYIKQNGVQDKSWLKDYLVTDVYPPYTDDELKNSFKQNGKSD